MSSCHRGVGQQRVEGTLEVKWRRYHFWEDDGAVWHVAENNFLRARHQRQLETFVDVGVGVDGDLVHTDVCRGHLSPFGQHEHATACLAVEVEGEGSLVHGVIDAVDRA